MPRTPNRTASQQVNLRLTPDEAATLQLAADRLSTPYAKVTVARFLLVAGLEAAQKAIKETEGQKDKRKG